MQEGIADFGAMERRRADRFRRLGMTLAAGCQRLVDYLQKTNDTADTDSLRARNSLQSGAVVGMFFAADGRVFGNYRADAGGSAKLIVEMARYVNFDNFRNFSSSSSRRNAELETFYETHCKVLLRLAY